MKNTPIKNIIIIPFIAIVLVIILVSWLKPKGNTISPTTNVDTSISKLETDTTTNTEVSTQIADNQKAIPAVEVGKSGIENMPNSLQGTEVDGEIIIDENKQLVVTYGLRRLFDYFLSLMGEETIEQISTRVENYIRSRTPEPAAGQAIEIYYAYIDYLKALSEVEKNFGQVQLQATQNGEIDLELIKQRRNEMKKLRQQYFNQETINAFFTSEDSFEDYTVSMLEIANDESLTVADKERLKEDYISRMPESEDKKALVEYRKQQENLAVLLERTAELKAKGASSHELYNMRVELVGEAAAERLAEVDAEESDFEQRFIQYEQQKQAIIAKFGADSTESQEKINEAASSLFNDAEIKRLDGYAAVRNANK